MAIWEINFGDHQLADSGNKLGFGEQSCTMKITPQNRTKMVYSLAKEYTENDDNVMGYHIKVPIKKSHLLADLKEAEAQIERGEYVTIDELKKESETW